MIYVPCSMRKSENQAPLEVQTKSPEDYYLQLMDFPIDQRLVRLAVIGAINAIALSQARQTKWGTDILCSYPGKRENQGFVVNRAINIFRKDHMQKQNEIYKKTDQDIVKIIQIADYITPLPEKKLQYYCHMLNHYLSDEVKQAIGGTRFTFEELKLTPLDLISLSGYLELQNGSELDHKQTS
jgi:hypothetical protein